MGFMDKLFGKGPQYPPLNESDPAGAEYKKAKDFIKKIVKEYSQSQDVSKSHRVGDKNWIEMVGAGNSCFLYIGTPPKVYAFAWKDGNGEFDFKDYVLSKKLEKPVIGGYLGGIGTFYEKYKSAPRYQADLEGTTVIVIDSKEMAEKLQQLAKEIQK